jgi:hypothetical protein
MSQTYPVMVNQPRIKLKAIRRRGAGSHRSDVGFKPSVTFSESRSKARPPKVHIRELVGEAYTVLSLAGIIGVLIYHIAG